MPSLSHYSKDDNAVSRHSINVMVPVLLNSPKWLSGIFGCSNLFHKDPISSCVQCSGSRV